jgi:hypothetical protein
MPVDVYVSTLKNGTVYEEGHPFPLIFEQVKDELDVQRAVKEGA